MKWLAPNALVPIFLLFYFQGAVSRPQQFDSNSLGDTFAIEDDLASRPFLLESGENYRDLLTITAAQNVAIFGIIKNRTEQKTLKPVKSGLFKKPSPKFQQTIKQLSPEPVYLTDREIFDFTDSRFIKPYAENIANYPIFVDAVDVVPNNLQGVGALENSLQQQIPSNFVDNGFPEIPAPVSFEQGLPIQETFLGEPSIVPSPVPFTSFNPDAGFPPRQDVNPSVVPFDAPHHSEILTHQDAPIPVPFAQEQLPLVQEQIPQIQEQVPFINEQSPPSPVPSSPAFSVFDSGVFGGQASNIPLAPAQDSFQSSIQPISEDMRTFVNLGK